MSLGRSVLLAFSAIALTSSPVLAQAANGSANLASRTGATVEESESIVGSILIPMLAVVAIVILAVVVTDNGDDAPTSP